MGSFARYVTEAFGGLHGTITHTLPRAEIRQPRFVINRQRLGKKKAQHAWNDAIYGLPAAAEGEQGMASLPPS